MTLKRAAAVTVAGLLLGFLIAGLQAWHAGYRVYAIQTGSMTPTAQPGDLFVDKPARDGYSAGDVITFRHSDGPDVVSHRITKITPQGIHTKGDGNRTADVWEIRPDQVQGVGVSKLAHMGFLLIFLKQPSAVLGVMTSGLALVLLWGICFPPEGATETALETAPKTVVRRRPAKPRRHLLQGA
jgi:signal peptidase I